MLQPIGLLSDAARRNRLRKLLTAVVLLFATQAPLLAQVEVELKYGGTLHGYVVAADDSTITLRVPAEGDAMRDAVLRRADITFLSGSDTVSPPPPPPPPAAESTEEEFPWYANPHDTLQYRNEITVGVNRDPLAGLKNPHFGLRYLYTSKHLLRDRNHMLESAVRTVPTGYLSVEAAVSPEDYTSSWDTKVFYGHLLRPALAVGGGIFLGSRSRAYDYASIGNRYGIDSRGADRYALAGRADFYPSQGMRLRETIGIGIVRYADAPTDSIGILLLARHRFDYAIRDLVLFEYRGYPVRLGYMNEFTISYREDAGTALQLRNGVESNLMGFGSVFAAINVTLLAPSVGETETEIGGDIGYRLHLGHRLSLILSKRFGSVVGWYVNTSDGDYSLLMQYRF